jgi:hypothetical protein
MVFANYEVYKTNVVSPAPNSSAGTETFLSDSR